MNQKLKQIVDALDANGLRELEAYVEHCEQKMGVTDDEASERGQAAEDGAQGKAKTLVHSAYRGRG